MRRVISTTLHCALLAFWISVLGAAITLITLVWGNVESIFSQLLVTLFGGVALAVAIGACALLFLGNRIRVLALIYTLSLVGALYLGELYFYTAERIATPKMENTVEEQKTSIKMLRSKLRQEGKRAYPALCPWVFLQEEKKALWREINEKKELLPLTGLSNNTIISGVSTMITDKYGFHNPPGQWQTEDVRVVVVGDSFAQGLGVSFGHSFSDNIRRQYGHAVNLGCSGNGPLTELASLIEYGDLLRPNTVVWAYFEGNDLNKDLEREFHYPLLRKYMFSEFMQNLAGRQAELDELMKIFLDRYQLEQHVRSAITSKQNTLMYWLKLSRVRQSLGLLNRMSFTASFTSESLTLFRRILVKAQTMTREWEGRLIFVYLPDAARFQSIFGKIGTDTARVQVLDMVSELGIQVIDVTPVFESHTDPISLYTGGMHYTELGHELVGSAIFEALDPYYLNNENSGK